jgi:Fe-S-cluster-containing hydrogenase component 2
MCSIAHEGAAQPALARIRITFDEFKEERPISGSVCFQCLDAACMEACPKGAMSRDEHTGAITIDEKRCIGCMLCQKACPWDIPVRGYAPAHPERRLAIVCDLCAGREEGPICVQMCPLSGKALRYEVVVAEDAPRAGVPACGEPAWEVRA